MSSEIKEGLLAVADAIDGLARAVYQLGHNNASTPMGAIEVLSLAIGEGAKEIAASIEANAPEL